MDVTVNQLLLNLVAIISITSLMMKQNTLEHNGYSVPSSIVLTLETASMILAGSFDPDLWVKDDDEF